MDQFLIFKIVFEDEKFNDNIPKDDNFKLNQKTKKINVSIEMPQFNVSASEIDSTDQVKFHGFHRNDGDDLKLKRTHHAYSKELFQVFHSIS